MVQNHHFREHVNLLGFLDYEIWKASHMLAQDNPLRKHAIHQHICGVDLKYQVWEDFGPCWNNERIEKKEDN